MSWWEQVSGQMLGVGMGLGAQGQSVDYRQRAYGAGMAYNISPQGNHIPIDAMTTTSDALYIDDAEAARAGISVGVAMDDVVEEPPDEFTRLSNHGFHELLDRFKETIGD